MFGYCNFSIVPCRKEPSHKSEMVTQLLFGDHFEIIDNHKEWVKVRNNFDSYEGWIPHSQYLPVLSETFNELSKSAGMHCVYDLIGIVSNTLSETNIFSVVLGSTLPFYKKGQFSIENTKYTYEGNVADGNQPEKREALIENAFMYMHAPYLWGGKTPFGIDCSGLVQMAFKLCGIKLQRDAKDQVQLGTSLGFVEEAIPGDLAFFDDDNGKITHTGIILNNQRIIHASGSVRVDKIDNHGIFNVDNKQHTHKLRAIRKLL